ncbi:molybdopterin-dependent oxidoreductase [Nonomuraea sp. FMUSA5-5]|uniref:Molybdopterin-dependent oxidoreductase n=1 Tax=Nonomuraea composti TaxID=2720023 RepID=A0ABX1BHV3_9ACTN|nr:molybdopterin-dependent oxidoreductase [Nonomuraea sp. FMUSA5-5]
MRWVSQLLTRAFGLEQARIRVIPPHVRGGFASKAYPVSCATLALMGARLIPDRPVEFTLTRQQMFALLDYRPAAIQRVRLSSHAGRRVTALTHDVIQQTASAEEYTGRMINSKTASPSSSAAWVQGLSMALHEQSVADPRFGRVVNNDLAGYHVAVNADVDAVEVGYVGEPDLYFNPMGSRGIDEIGIMGTAAAIADAVHHATGIRVRVLPITLDKLALFS